MNDLRLWANYYYNMGFNVTHIIPELNKGKAKNIYKSPTNDRHKIANVRQSLSEMQSLDWESSSGIGVVLGFNNLRALDFDFYYEGGVSRIYPPQPPHYFDKEYFSTTNTFIQHTLFLLGLPIDYEWVTITPSGGFHILFYSKQHRFSVKENLTKAFMPNDLTYSGVGLKHIELRWDKHLILPPSINKDGIFYKFYNNKYPKKTPSEIDVNKLYSMLDEYCFDNIYNRTGYNTMLGDYYETMEDTSFLQQYYSFGEYLDFSPVYFEIEETKQGIPDSWIKE